MSGYFKNSNIHIDLGQHCFATPSLQRRTSKLSKRDRPAYIHAQGGGILSLEVTSQRVRDNRGDAEWWIYSRLHELITAEPGTLGFEDALGNQHAYADCTILSGEGEVFGGKFANITLDIECPETSASASFGSLPDVPSAYGSATDTQDYTAGGVSLGQGGSLRIEGYRETMLREIPRARGARISPRYRGGTIELHIEADLVASGQALSAVCEEKQRSIGAGLVDVTGNGLTYTGCVLSSVSPEHTDWRNTTVNYTFLQNLNEGGLS